MLGNDGDREDIKDGSCEGNQNKWGSAELPKNIRKRKWGRIIAVASICLVVSVSSLINSAGANFPGNDDGSSESASVEAVFLTGSLSETLSIPEIAEMAAPTVVEITTEVLVTGQRTPQYISEGAGSGVILTEDGYIVTNNHVIEGAQKISVRLVSGDEYEAELIGTDEQTDVAIIKIEASGLSPAALGDSSTLVVGNQVVAIGNPLGQLGGTVTDGIISALDRDITLDDQTMSLLQTNAAINPGNSGGGLFDGSGNLIGIVVAKSSGTDVEGLGFAIPINDVKSVMLELMEHGYVQGRIELGMTFLDIASNQEAMMYRVSQTGVYVLNVTSGSNAAAAGFRSGDLVVSLDGTKVSSAAEITSIIDSFEAGEDVEFTVIRISEERSLTLTLEESKPSD
ncbi:S1C family serine protease [Youngiibacter multivorans]|uniref:Serine protease Do n=1 Tax=Youngiibacter multivorans TaxID=937251 RepID=A0ABS4G430_9CLOT|nr:trypsin-like peptidase domain-containing protein [Youngiibacter multivorans]MBP1919303.1 serine protease Do [Youngiibacter multivorans]